MAFSFLAASWCGHAKWTNACRISLTPQATYLPTEKPDAPRTHCARMTAHTEGGGRKKLRVEEVEPCMHDTVQ